MCYVVRSEKTASVTANHCKVFLSVANPSDQQCVVESQYFPVVSTCLFYKRWSNSYSFLVFLKRKHVHDKKGLLIVTLN